MTLPVIIIGAGDLAKVLVDALRLLNIRPLALTSIHPHEHGTRVLGIPVGGDNEWLLRSYPPNSVRLVNAIGAIRQPIQRRGIFIELTRRGYTFETVIHPSAVVAADVRLGEGVQIMAGAVVQPGTQLHDNVLLNFRAAVDHDCVVGPHSQIAPGATLSGSIRVGEATMIGAGATLIQGITVGRECLIAAGAAVVADVADGLAVAGVPARAMRKS